MKKHTKRALLLSALSLLLCISMLVGSTFAWFTDSVTSAGNKIQAGTLKIDLLMLDKTDGTTWTSVKDSKAPLFNYDKWEPGYTDVTVLKVANRDTLALKWLAKFVSADNAVGELAEVIDVYVKEDVTAYPALRTDLEGWTKVGTVKDFVNTIETTTTGSLEAGAEEKLGIALKMQETAGNEYQNKSVGLFDIQILATQYTFEEDSFGKDYDENATYPIIVNGTKTVGEELTLPAEEVTVKVPATAPAGIYTLDVSEPELSTDAEGKTTAAFNIDLLRDGVKVEADGTTKYAVEINVGSGLTVTEVLHKGDAIADYTYVPAEGIVSFETASFSPFAVSYGVVHVSTAEDLQNLLVGEDNTKENRRFVKIILDRDIIVDAETEMMYTKSNGAHFWLRHIDVLLDLNGHNITVASDALMNGKPHANAVLLVQYCDLDIVGEGSIIAANKAIPVYGWAHSTIDIYGGKYVTNAYERNESAVYVNNPNVTINVYGGDYSESVYAFNVHDNCGTTPVIVLHEGVSYETFLKNGTIDVTQSDLNNGRIMVADGCELNKIDNINTVVAK